MEKNKKEIFVGYRRVIGITDIQGIADYIKSEKPFKKVYLIATLPLAGPVSEYLKKNLEPLVPVKFILTDNFEKAIKEIKNQCKDREVWVTDLNDFGDRVLSFDPG